MDYIQKRMSNFNEPHNKKIISEEIKTEIIKRYLEDARSEELCELAGFRSRSSLILKLKEWGVLRSRSESRKSVARMGVLDRTCADIDFLSSWSPASAWIWGLWFGDGWVTKPKKNGGSVSLCGQESVMQMVKDLSGCTSKIFRKKKKDGTLTNTYTLHIGGNNFVKLVENKFGILPGKKSHTMQWPKDVPEEMLPHFIRGLWDSDGSWWVQGNRDIDYLYSAYCSCSVDFLESLRHILHEKIGVKVANIESTWNDEWEKEGHVIRFASQDSTRIGNFMYNTGVDISTMRHPNRFVIFEYNKISVDSLK